MPSIEDITQSLVHDQPIRIILAGHAGIGKTSLARNLVKLNAQIKHVELDQLSKKNLKCSISCFDLVKCFGPEISNVDSFVIDVGGGHIFRKKANNKLNLKSIIDFKLRHNIKIILLHASRDVIKARYFKHPDSHSDGFDLDWETWFEVGLPNWKQCCDYEFDVSLS